MHYMRDLQLKKQFDKAFRDLLGQNEFLEEEIDQRYAECDQQGHYSPDEEQNLCLHCYRNLETNSPLDQTRRERSGLPIDHIPCDAAVLNEQHEIYKIGLEMNDRVVARGRLRYLFPKK